ncbi:hypothetical protein FKM82_028345 [Ascaphus truei]
MSFLVTSHQCTILGYRTCVDTQSLKNCRKRSLTVSSCNIEEFSFQTLRPRIPEESKCRVICRIVWSEYSTGDNLQLAVFTLLLTYNLSILVFLSPHTYVYPGVFGL